MTEIKKSLERKIAELENELVIKDQDLLRYKTELTKVNKHIEAMIRDSQQSLKIMHSMQKLLVPTEYPSIPGVMFSTKFMPGSKKGGDYFDIFEHEDKFRFGILLASSSGHSISALFLSVLLKMTGQMEAKKGTPPDVVMQNIAAEMLPAMSQDSSASVFYGIIDRRTFELTYTHIGANTVLYRRHAGEGEEDELKWLEPHGPKLSKTTEAGTFTLGSLHLEAHDQLIFCSPGLTELTNRKGQVFGPLYLMEALQSVPFKGVHELRNEILYSLESFNERGDFEQDLTVLVVEVKDRVLKLART